MSGQLMQFVNERLSMLIILVVFAVLDVIGGSLIAWKQGEFRWEKVPEFLKTFVSYLWAWISAELIGFLPALLNVQVAGLTELVANYMGSAVFAFVVLKYVTSIVTHIQNTNALPLRAENALVKLGVPPTNAKG